MKRVQTLAGQAGKPLTLARTRSPKLKCPFAFALFAPRRRPGAITTTASMRQQNNDRNLKTASFAKGTIGKPSKNPATGISGEGSRRQRRSGGGNRWLERRRGRGEHWEGKEEGESVSEGKLEGGRRWGIEAVSQQKGKRARENSRFW